MVELKVIMGTAKYTLLVKLLFPLPFSVGAGHGSAAIAQSFETVRHKSIVDSTGKNAPRDEFGVFLEDLFPYCLDVGRWHLFGTVFSFKRPAPD
jgi:hypothetical protein